MREEPDVAAQLGSRLRGAYPRALPGDAARTAAPVDRATAERLRSLGYVGSSPSRRAARLADLPDPKDKVAVYELLQEALAAGEQRKIEEANAGLRRVLALDGRIVDAHLNLGVNYTQSGKFAAAADHFKQVLALDPANVLATFNLALCYAQLGRLDEAILGFRRTLELDGSDAAALAALGRAYQLKGDLERALDALRRAVEREPRMADAHLFLAEVYAARGEKREAQAEREKARALGAR